MWVMLPRRMKEINCIQLSVFWSISIFLNHTILCLIKPLLPFFQHNFDRMIWKISASELCLGLLLNPITVYYHKKHQSENYWWCMVCEHATVNSKYKYFNSTNSQNHGKARWNSFQYGATHHLNLNKILKFCI